MKVQQAIESKLKDAFDASILQVENESHMHSVPPNSETHFKVTLVSPTFEGQMKVKRHQTLYKVLADELAGPVHAHWRCICIRRRSGRPVAGLRRIHRTVWAGRRAIRLWR